MSSIKVSKEYASIAKPILFEVEEAGSNRAKIIVNGEVVGEKRYTDNSFAVDVAPYLRGAFVCEPLIGEYETVAPTGRLATAQIEVAGQTSEQLRFIASREDCAELMLLSNMPLRRTLAVGERDELSFTGMEIVDTETTVVVMYEDGSEWQYLSGIVSSYATSIIDFDSLAARSQKRIKGLRVATGSGTERVSEVYYDIVKRPNRSVRLAWLNSLGGVDYYTFDSLVSQKSATKRVESLTARGEGRSVACQSVLTSVLRSAHEPREMVEALSDIISSPAVWVVESEAFRRVSVVSSEVQTDNCDTPVSVKIEIAESRQKVWEV